VLIELEITSPNLTQTTNKTTFELSVVIPIHNEIDHLASLTQEIYCALTPHFAFEVIYVDDGSQDNSLEHLQALQQEFSTLKIIRHQRSCGQSRALYTGIRYAHAPWIVTLDGDGQNDPADIPKLWQALTCTESPQLTRAIVGYRIKRQDSFAKRFASIIANAIRAQILRDKTPDTGCGLKLFSRDFFLNLPYFDHMHRFLPALMQRHGGEVVSVAVNHRPRMTGRSNYGTLDRLAVGIPDLLGVYWLVHRCRLPVIEHRDQHNAK